MGAPLSKGALALPAESVGVFGRHRDPCDDPRNAEVIAFLRRHLTLAEQLWPRFVPELRAVRDVTMGELRTHPDLVGELIDLAPSRKDAWMLMGAPVLIAPSGVMYATAFSMHELMVRCGDVADPRLLAPASREEPVGPGWHALNVWLSGVPRPDRPAARRDLMQLVARARSTAAKLRS